MTMFQTVPDTSSYVKVRSTAGNLIKGCTLVEKLCTHLMDFVRSVFNRCYVLDAALLLNVSWTLSNKSSPVHQRYSASFLMLDTEGCFVIPVD